jgi:hypothetical protein
LAAVRSGGRVGFINRNGKFVLAPQYASAWNFNDGVAAAKDWISGKWGFVDRNGAWVVKPQFKDALSYSEGLAAVTNSDLGIEPGWGYVDRRGEMVIPPAYSLALSFHEGLALVLTLKDGEYQGRYINRDGHNAFEANCHGGNHFAQGLAPVPLAHGQFGFIDKSGKTIIQPQFRDAHPFNEDLAVVRFDDNVSWGLIDKSGKVVLRRSRRDHAGLEKPDCVKAQDQKQSKADF